MFNFFNKTDSEIQKDVMNEIQWDPSVTSDQVSVATKDGIVTLRGCVPHYSEKAQAEAAAQRVGGVRAVVDEIEVKMMGYYEKTDEQIAEAAVNALSWNYSVPKGVKVTVEKGWITLKGELQWDYQRIAAKNAVLQLMGVVGVSNNISIKTSVKPRDIQSRIEEALKRSAEREGREIKVSVNGDCVTLSGKLHSFSEVQDAKNAAWMAPGVRSVESHLIISK